MGRTVGRGFRPAGGPAGPPHFCRASRGDAGGLPASLSRDSLDVVRPAATSMLGSGLPNDVRLAGPFAALAAPLAHRPRGVSRGSRPGVGRQRQPARLDAGGAGADGVRAGGVRAPAPVRASGRPVASAAGAALDGHGAGGRRRRVDGRAAAHGARRRWRRAAAGVRRAVGRAGVVQHPRAGGAGLQRPRSGAPGDATAALGDHGHARRARHRPIPRSGSLGRRELLQQLGMFGAAAPFAVSLSGRAALLRLPGRRARGRAAALAAGARWPAHRASLRHPRRRGHGSRASPARRRA